MIQKFFVFEIFAPIITAVIYYYFNVGLLFMVILIVLLVVGFANASQHKHTILRNFPVLDYFRYLFEMIAPEIHQYFIERSTDGKPFSSNERSLVYQRAKNIDSNTPFGTQLNLNQPRYEGIKHSIFPTTVNEKLPRVLIGGADCTQPYSASLLNISAMSFDILSENAIVARNKGALKGKFYDNACDGGLTQFHQQGGDVCWQIGTGYFGCRDDRGGFDGERFAEKANLPEVKMIEIKLSQGAKPGHGGVLPAAKNTVQIAKIRGVLPHTTILSPSSHSAFDYTKGLIDFIIKLHQLSNVKPTGFKLCIGDTREFEIICQEMITQNCFPDFITVSGTERGTGAAALEFADGVGMSFDQALIFVNKTLVRFGIRDKIRIICSGKIISGYSILRSVALGTDICNSARGFMFS